MKELETIDAETLLYNPLKETEFIVDEYKCQYTKEQKIKNKNVQK